MRALARQLLFLLEVPLVLVARHPAIRDAVDRDIRRLLQPRHDLPLPASYSRADLVRSLRHPPLRTTIYTRLNAVGGSARVLSMVLSRLYRGAVALEISCSDIGPGLLFHHGFATIVLAKRIGVDCQFGQQVTVGYDDRGGPPTIGDRVRVGANSVVIGPITLGDDCVVGAGAVVIRDVPPGVVVGGVPARVLENAEDRYSALRTANARDPVL